MAHKRPRGPLWYSAVVFLLVITVSVGFYAFLIVRIQTARPTIERDYVAEINEAANRHPTHETAGQLYRAVSLAGALVAFPPDHPQRQDTLEELRELAVTYEADPRVAALIETLAAKLEPGPAVEHDPNTDLSSGIDIFVDPDHEHWPRVREAARRVPELFELLHLTSAKPAAGPPFWPESGSILFDQELRFVRPFRATIRTADLGLSLAIDEGDGDAAFACVAANLALTEQMSEQPFLVVSLVRCAARSILLGRLRSLLAEQPEFFTSEQLESIASMLEENPVGVDYSSERLLYDDALQRTWSASGVYIGLDWLGEGGFNPMGGVPPAVVMFVRPIESMLMGSREANARFGAELYDTAEDMLTTLPADWTDRHLGLSDRATQAGGLANILLPALQSTGWTHHQLRVEQHATLAALACERFRRANGRYPQSLRELVSSHLSSVPLDPFSGDPILYLPRDDGFTLYSIGNDRVDDGGTRDGSARDWGSKPVPDEAAGDWILYPIE